MKLKAGRLFLIVLLTTVLGTSIHAMESEGGTYRIYGADARISFPQGYSVYTQNKDEAEEYADRYGIAATDIYDFLFSRGFELGAVNEEGSEEYYVNITGSYGSQHEMTEDEFEEYYQKSVEELEKIYRDAEETELYDIYPFVTEEFKFVVYVLYYKELNLHQLIAVTDSSAYDLNIMLNCPDEKESFQDRYDLVKEEFGQVLKSMVNEETPNLSETHQMIFLATGAVFTVPDAWRTTTFVNEGLNGLQMERIIDNGEDHQILVIVQELYESAQEDGFTGTRAALDKVYEADNVMAAIMGIEEEEIQTARFGDYKYFLTKETEDDGSVLLQYFIVKNGILYMFQYDADTDDDYYPVLEQTLSTVDYAVEG